MSKCRVFCVVALLKLKCPLGKVVHFGEGPLARAVKKNNVNKVSQLIK